MPYITANGCELYFEEAGQGSPAVYVHGGFAGLDTVLRDAEAQAWNWELDFAAACHFVAYDRRGCARSSSSDSGYDLVNQARDLAGLLDHLAINRAHVIGSSAGGPIAVIFAALYPLRTRSLVLTGTAIDLFPVGDPDAGEVRRQLIVLERDGAAAAFVRRPSGVEVTFNELWDEPEAVARGTLDAYRARVERNREQARQLPTEQRVRYYAIELRSMQAYLNTTVAAFASAVSAPAYMLHGSRDKMVPVADAQRLAQMIPGALLEVMDGGSHTLLARSAEARLRVIDWMARVDRPLYRPVSSAAG